MSELLTQTPLNLEQLLDETASPASGALLIFAGTVRDYNAGKRVTRLEYSAYDPLAERALAAIEVQAKDQFDILDCRLLHRLGEVEIGEVSVYVVIRSVHRGEAFDAGRWAIDTLKHKVAIWKREEYDDGSHVFVQGCALHEDGDDAGHEHDNDQVSP